MSNTTRQVTTEKERNVDPDKQIQSPVEDKGGFPFSFFDDGTGTINISGIEVDLNRKFQVPEPPPESSSAQEEEPQIDQPEQPQQEESNPDVDQDNSPQQETRPNLSIIAAAEETYNDEPADSQTADSSNHMERSAKLFAETKSHLQSYRANVDTEKRQSPQFNGSLDIEPDQSVEAVPSPSDLEKLDAEYAKSTLKVSGLTIEGKAPAADRSNTKPKEPWLVHIFIVAPIKGLFRALYYHGLRDLLGFIGNVLKFLIISAVLTVGAYIVMAYYSDSGLSALEMAIQHYEVVKKVGIALYEDIYTAVRGKEGQ